MVSIRPSEQERVQQLNDMSIVPIELCLWFIFFKGFNPFGILNVFGYLLQNFDFIVGSFDVVRSTFHDFHCNVVIVFEILSEPNGGEVSPSKLLNKYIAVEQHLADEAGMIPSHLIILNSLIFTVIFLIEMMQKLVQGPKFLKYVLRLLLIISSLVLFMVAEAALQHRIVIDLIVVLEKAFLWRVYIDVVLVVVFVVEIELVWVGGAVPYWNLGGLGTTGSLLMIAI